MAMAALAAISLLCLACTFPLEDVRTQVPEGGLTHGDLDAATDASTDASTDVLADALLPDLVNDGFMDEGQGDGCWPPTDEAFCESAGRECDIYQGTDECGVIRIVASCGTCLETAYCNDGICVSYVFTWKASGWSACSKPCDGGVRTRDVWCEREDGLLVTDAYCVGSKPATQEACNTHACCNPSCVSRDACGSDGCGGSCGSCSGDRYCYSGYCIWDHGNDGSVSCDTLCAWGHSSCVGTSTGASCSTKAVTKCYCW